MTYTKLSDLLPLSHIMPNGVEPFKCNAKVTIVLSLQAQLEGIIAPKK